MQVEPPVRRARPEPEQQSFDAAGSLSSSGFAADASAGDGEPGEGGERGSLAMLADGALTRDQDDLLGYTTYAEALATLIDNPATSTPLTVAIHAPWGVGKTSLASLIQARLETRLSSAGSQPHVCCWFDAWMHDDAKQLSSALAAFVAREMDRRRPWLLRFRRPLPHALCSSGQAGRMRLLDLGLKTLVSALLAALVLGVVMLFPGFGAVFGEEASRMRVLVQQNPGTFTGALIPVILLAISQLRRLFPIASTLAAFVRDVQGEASAGTVGEVREQLGHLIEEALPPGSRLVLFVDNLERCRPPGAIELMEGVNQLLGHERVIVVLLADVTAVAAQAVLRYEALARHLGPDTIGFGQRYIQKFVQLQFDIPEPPRKQLEAMLAALTAPSAPASGAETRKKNKEKLKSEGFMSSRWVSLLVFAACFALLAGTLHGLARPGSGLLGSAFFKVPIALGLAGGLASLWGLAVKRWRERRVDRVRARVLAWLEAHPADEDPEAMVRELGSVKDAALARSLLAERRRLHRMNDSDFFRTALDEVTEHLPRSPRHVKRIVNRLRLLVFIVLEKGLSRGTPMLSARQVARWAVLQERWPELAAVLAVRPRLASDLEAGSTSPDAFGLAWAHCGSSLPADEETRVFFQDADLLSPVIPRLTRLHFEEG